MLARAGGAARVVVFDVSEPRLALARTLGADVAANPIAIQRDGGARPRDIVRDVTRGQGADLQVEAAGAAAETLPEINASFAPNGKMVYLGRARNAASIEFDSLVSRANIIAGSRGHAGHRIYPNIIRLMETGRIPAGKMITTRLPFERIMEAIHRAAKRVDGKVVVTYT